VRRLERAENAEDKLVIVPTGLSYQVTF